MSGSKPIFLDVDSSIVENNLRITNEEDELGKLFGPKPFEYPSKLVKPHPGLCIKTKELSTLQKVFINICTTDAIPPPKDITEAELEGLIEAEDASDFRVPMSIGEVRIDKCKAEEDEAKIIDIAINPNFFHKIQNQSLFKNFFLTIVFEGIHNKHGITCADKKIILTNRKAMGTLQTHRIQQREIDEKMGTAVKENKTALNELTGEKQPSTKKVVIETISSIDNVVKEPEYRLFKKKPGPNYLYGEFKLPNLVSAKDLLIDIGEDRIVLEAKAKGYFLDIFIPYCVRAAKCVCVFDKGLKVLKMEMPVIGG